MFCGETYDRMRNDLESFIEVAHRLGDEFDAVIVPVQSHL